MTFRPNPHAKAVIGILSIFVFLYCGFWLYLSLQIGESIKNFVAQAPSLGIVFQNTRPRVFGFPFVPTIYFSGEIRVNGVPLLIPEMKIQGYFIPGTRIRISLPDGLAVGSRAPDLTSVDKAYIAFLMPSDFPATMYQDDILHWQQKVGAIDISDITLHKKEMKTKAKGYIALDDTLQLRAEFDTKTYGHEDFLVALKKKGVLHRGDYVLLSAALNGMSDEDPLSKDKVLKTTVSIKNKVLFIGPVPVARLPALVWGRRSSPVLLPR